MSVDGDVQAQERGLYLPIYVDWRAKNGSGIAYFRRPPSDDYLIQTAAGDLGRPTRDLGDGWWWVE
ncbi:hypothetical protein ACFOY2_37575 [Nonomuraea purpurea]|uniref:Uncharacterized protein n=1 Tax=Nonomuraea purpurea TaxID=1849276 RepID=A0ABV8GGM9_9ACTN